VAKKKTYSKPQIIRIELDQSLNLMMLSPPGNPMMMPTGSGNKGTDNPFASPFDDKPFG
jgi:hypothetical protein